MPEGHTIHRLAARHFELFGGSRLQAASPQGRFDAASLKGAVLRETEAYGKHLLHRYGNGLTLHVHLGLYGKFSDGPMPFGEPVGQVRLRLWNRKHWVDLRGPTACEVLFPGEVAALRGRLGADPLRADADPDAAYARIARSPTPLAALLLDQSIVAGTGLIFVIESLFRARLKPTVPGRSLTPEAWHGIWHDLCMLMEHARKTGTIDTVIDDHMPEAMGRPPRIDRHGGEVYVYRRAGLPCHVCGDPVRRGTLVGRNTYWCASCQLD
jgi:endonuclease VIII